MKKVAKIKSNFKGVYYHEKMGWITCIDNATITWLKHCKNEREAAIAYDFKLIELGKEPVNILKRKMCDEVTANRKK